MIEMTRHVLITFLISGNDVISLASRPLNFRVIIPAYRLRPQKYFRSSLTRVLNQLRNKSSNTIKGKYHVEYSTVGKVGSEKPLAGKYCFV